MALARYLGDVPQSAPQCRYAQGVLHVASRQGSFLMATREEYIAGAAAIAKIAQAALDKVPERFRALIPMDTVNEDINAAAVAAIDAAQAVRDKKVTP
jgi:hypothetical protein